MKILTPWLRSYLPPLPVDDAQLAEDLTLRGIAVEGVFELNDASADSDGALFDMDITTNRVDAMNHYGIAREAAAIYNLPLHKLHPHLPTPLEATPFPIEIQAPTLCPRFTAQVIRGVKIAPSQGLIAHYFHHLGQKQISNAVDISNFILLGIGHPTHAFDLDKIHGGLIIRQAHPGEQLRLLDGSTRTLVPADLVIADHTRAISLAGVMGGYDTMITPETTNILVEAAWFDPATIRATSRRHLLHTDASHRYERGADIAAPPLANALVTEAILAACGGTLAGPMQDLYPAPISRPTITLSAAHTQRLLGTTLAPEGITPALIQQYLQALGCTLTGGPEPFTVELPTWRLDLTRPIDLIEEIARLYGYNRFANTLPTPGVTVAHPLDRPLTAIRQRLLALGYSEALSSTFTSTPDSTLFAPEIPTIPLENPLSEEAANLRPSLLPGMVAMLAHNLTRDTLSARLFEQGQIFTGTPEAVHEHQSLTLGLTGPLPPTDLHLAADAPFFELKGALESLFSLFEIPTPTLTPQSPAIFEQGRAATYTLAGQTLAHFGQFATTHRKLRQPIYLATVSLELLLAHPLRRPIAQDLSRFQAVDRDFSFLFPDHVTWAQIESTIRALALPELQSITPLEIWRDPKKHPGLFASLTRTTFQSTHRTLTEADLLHFWTVIIAALQQLGGTIRDH